MPATAVRVIPVTRHVPRIRLQRIVIGVDFSEPSIAAAEWTVKHFAPGAEHFLAHAVDIPASGELFGRFPRRAEVVGRMSEDALNRLRQMREEWSVPELRLDVHESTPCEALSDLATYTVADLIVVGEHTHLHEAALSEKSTAENVLKSTQVPILLARGMRPHAPRRILAAVHDARDTPEVLRWSRLLADLHDARVTACHVFHQVSNGVAHLVAGTTAIRAMQAQIQHSVTWLSAQLHEAGFAPGEADMEVLAGDYADELLASQRRGDFDLMVIGSRRLSRVMRAIVGNTGVKLIRRADCPVLITHSDE
jgi:nucleotide-binding universal stress UspA family protein